MSSKESSKSKDKSKVHKLSLKGSARLVAEFVSSSTLSSLSSALSQKLTTDFQCSLVPILHPQHPVRTRLAPTPLIHCRLTHPPGSSEVSTQRKTLQRSSSPTQHQTQHVTNKLHSVKKYGLNMLVSADDQVKAYIKKIMSQLDKWMVGGKISKLVIVITDKDTGEHVERWQFDVRLLSLCSNQYSLSWPMLPSPPILRSQNTQPVQHEILTNHTLPQVQIFQTTKSKSKSKSKPSDQENVTGATPAAPAEKTEPEIQAEIAAIFRQITASVTFLPQLSGDCTFNVLVYADADSEVPVEWGDSTAKEIENGERVQLRGFSTASHRVDTLVSYRLAE